MGIEKANEWDNVAGQHDPSWVEDLRSHQEELYRQVKERWPSMRANNFDAIKITAAGTWKAKPVFAEIRAVNRRA